MWTLRDLLKALLNWKQLPRPGGQLVVVDAPWFPNGIEANTTEGFIEHYGGTVAEALPLAQARSIKDTLAIVRQAGFQHVTATSLTPPSPTWNQRLTSGPMHLPCVRIPPG